MYITVQDFDSGGGCVYIGAERYMGKFSLLILLFIVFQITTKYEKNSKQRSLHLVRVHILSLYIWVWVCVGRYRSKYLLVYT
jgi:hypothetical protein